MRIMSFPSLSPVQQTPEAVFGSKSGNNWGNAIAP
jgi:hypothetical protein